MSIGRCRLIGIEGSHGTGKSTLALAVTAAFKCKSVSAGCLAERDRESPFLDAAVNCSDSAIVPSVTSRHADTHMVIHSELHLLAAQILREEVMARCHELVVCDKTVASGIGYLHLALGGNGLGVAQKLVNGMEELVKAYVRVYDVVFYSSDLYESALVDNSHRPVDAEFQRKADVAIRQACYDAGLALNEIPVGLCLEEKVKWIVRETESILER